MSSKSEDRTEDFLYLFSTIRRVAGGKPIIGNSIERLAIFYEHNKANIDQQVAKRMLFFKLPQVCFENHLEDLVPDVLRTIHGIGGAPHLVLFLSVLCLEHQTLPEGVWRRREEMGLCSFSKMAFFLHHAQSERLVFDGKRRLVDLMVDAADPKLFSRLVLFGDERSVRTLVQFGLRFQLPNDSASRVHPFFLQAAEILSRLIKKTRLWRRRRHDANNNNQKMSVFGRNLKLLLSATANPFEVTSQIVYILPLWSGLKDLRGLKPHLGGFFPYERPADYRPAPLKHLCRHAVRSRLRDNWCLPYGVWRLPVSREVKAYLNYSDASK